uniref:Bulb-type lectin domain-containing protein n=1 Tax=viral metagenome TaxID=1070528 RepID=A0A6C0HY32_9ZZZZ
MSFIKFQNVVLNNSDANTLEISGNFSLGSSVNYSNYIKIGPWNIKSVGSGVLDPTFGNNGIIDTDFSMNYSISTSLVIDKKNNIIIGGSEFNNDNASYAFAKYLPTGQLDTTFGNQGVVITDLSNDIYFFNGFFNGPIIFNKIIAIDSNNNIIFSGTVGEQGDYHVVLARYDENGNIDTNFGSSGYVLTDFSGNDSSQEFSVQVDLSDNIVVAGLDTDSNGNNYYALAKYLPTGIIDLTFGNEGFIVSNFSGNDNSSALSLVIDKQNNIVVAGVNNESYAFSKYSSSGNLIRTIVTNFDYSGDYSSAFSVAIDQQNNIIIGGVQFNNLNSDYNYALAKYDQNGDIIISFGDNGTIIADFSNNNYSLGLSVVVDLQNNIIIGGFSDGLYALAKYSQYGDLDTDFGNSGSIVTSYSANPSFSFVNSLAIDEHNNIFVSGYEAHYPDINYGIAKYFNSANLVAQLGDNGPSYSMIFKY